MDGAVVLAECGLCCGVVDVWCGREEGVWCGVCSCEVCRGVASTLAPGLVELRSFTLC